MKRGRSAKLRDAKKHCHPIVDLFAVPGILRMILMFLVPLNVDVDWPNGTEMWHTLALVHQRLQPRHWVESFSARFSMAETHRQRHLSMTRAKLCQLKQVQQKMITSLSRYTRLKSLKVNMTCLRGRGWSVPPSLELLLVSHPPLCVYSSSNLRQLILLELPCTLSLDHFDFPNLENLHIQCCEFFHTACLIKFKKLQDLRFSHCSNLIQISDAPRTLVGLSVNACPHLTHVASPSPLTRLDLFTSPGLPVAKFALSYTSLRNLDFQYYIDSFQEVLNFVSLQFLRIHWRSKDCPSDLHLIKALPLLERLVLEGNVVTQDLLFIHEMPALQELYLKTPCSVDRSMLPQRLFPREGK